MLRLPGARRALRSGSPQPDSVRKRKKSGKNNPDRDKVPQVPPLPLQINYIQYKVYVSRSNISTETLSYQIRFSRGISYTTAKFTSPKSGCHNYNRQRHAILRTQIHHLVSFSSTADYHRRKHLHYSTIIIITVFSV